ncbi:MAG TPA: adenosine kinase [Acidimicrobiales bacterium]|nr:adenosine kinase [Acidimicrobiales bacterium]
MTTRMNLISQLAKDRKFDVICVGTALIDHLSIADLSTVAELGLAAGTMTLIDDETATRARATLGAAKLVSGGTVANTAAGIASFTGRPAFVGAVARDEFGERYAHDLRSAGVHPMLTEITDGDGRSATGACYVMVTPDQERTMATHLGVSGQLRVEHLSKDLLADCAVCYFDGYLLDFPGADEIVQSLIASAKTHGTALALGLADPFVVDRHREALIGLLPDISLLFSNHDEILSLGECGDIYKAAERFRHQDMAVVVTRSELGAVVIWEEGMVQIDAVPVEQVVDVTGAGDLFASGMLYGCVREGDYRIGAELGALAASEVISHLGARPEHSLLELARGAGILS